MPHRLLLVLGVLTLASIASAATADGAADQAAAAKLSDCVAAASELIATPSKSPEAIADEAVAVCPEEAGSLFLVLRVEHSREDALKMFNDTLAGIRAQIVDKVNKARS
jgi:hypothetical protein